TAHPGLVLRLQVTAGSKTTLRAKADDVRRLAREHRQRLTLNVSNPVDDLRILGGDREHSGLVGDLADGLEWHTAALPFTTSAITAFAKSVRAEPLLANEPWTLRPLDSRAVVWLFPFVYRKNDPAGVESLGRRVEAFERIRTEFSLPVYRSGGVRGGP
ncbi:hypothetical protein ACFQ07_16000, partial [Actinomadura adrarensis]